MEQLYGLVILAFYIITLIVIGPSFDHKKPPTNISKQLQTAQKVLAYIVMVVSAIAIPWILMGCGFVSKNIPIVGAIGWGGACLSALLLTILPFLSSVLVISKKIETNLGRKAVILMVWLHISIILLLLVMSPFVAYYLVAKNTRMIIPPPLVHKKIAATKKLKKIKSKPKKIV